MEIEIIDKKDNPLLERLDVTFRVEHEGEKTPQRSAVRDKLAEQTGAKPAAVVITRMRSRFGRPVTEGAAKVYKSADAAAKTEVPHLLKRHGLSREGKAKDGGGEKAAAKAKTPAKAEPAAKAEAPAKTEPASKEA